jgi:hypothetical protein
VVAEHDDDSHLLGQLQIANKMTMSRLMGHTVSVAFIASLRVDAKLDVAGSAALGASNTAGAEWFSIN